MMFQLTWEDDGVVLEAYTDLLGGRHEWVRLRKFIGEGDAKLFREVRCPKLTDNEVKMLARKYVGLDHYTYCAGRWMKTLRVY